MSIFDELDSLPDDPAVLRAALKQAQQEFNTVRTELQQLRAAKPGDPVPAAASQAASTSRGKTVIAIDDSKVMQMRYRALLSTFGWDLLAVAENGVHGAELVLTRRPCVVLLDYEMPVMNGVETLAAIRRVDKEVGVIVVSGTLTTELLQTLMRNGASDVLVKPINETKLREALERCVSSSSLPQPG